MMTTSNLSIKTKYGQISGRIFSRENRQSDKLLIMCHGLGGQQNFGLSAFVEGFVSSGFDVVTFDYSGWGASQNRGQNPQPNHVILPNRQLADIEYVLNYLKSEPVFKNHKVYLWGSSFGGGHVLRIAAKRRDVSGVVAQVPYINALSTLGEFPLGLLVRLGGHGLWDMVKAVFGKAHYVPLAVKPGKLGFLTTAESLPGYQSLVPENEAWSNQLAARLALVLPFYNPNHTFKAIRCPVLVVAGQRDSLIPIQAIRTHIQKINHHTLVELNSNHFDVYQGALFENNMKAQTNFLNSL